MWHCKGFQRCYNKVFERLPNPPSLRWGLFICRLRNRTNLLSCTNLLTYLSLLSLFFRLGSIEKLIIVKFFVFLKVSKFSCIFNVLFISHFIIFIELAWCDWCVDLFNDLVPFFWIDLVWSWTLFYYPKVLLWSNYIMLYLLYVWLNYEFSYYTYILLFHWFIEQLLDTTSYFKSCLWLCYGYFVK